MLSTLSQPGAADARIALSTDLPCLQVQTGALASIKLAACHRPCRACPLRTCFYCVWAKQQTCSLLTQRCLSRSLEATHNLAACSADMHETAQGSGCTA